MMSKSNAFGLLLAGLLFGLVFSIASALPQMPEETNTGVELRKSSGEVYQNVSDLRLASEKTAKRAGESLSTLLARNGVKFGGSSVSLFYELNPDITDFGSLPVGTVINVPSVHPSAEIQEALEKGFLIYISTDKILKKEVVSAIQKFVAEKPSFVGLDSSVFGGTEAKSTLISTIDESIAHLRDVRVLIQEDAQPFTTEALRQYRDDTEVLLSTMKSVSAARRLSAADRTTILLIFKDISTKSRSLNASKAPDDVARYPEATMIVTVKPERDPRVGLNRICYAVEALVAKRNRCSTTLGPVRLVLPVADYVVWMAAGESSAPLTLFRPVLLEREGDSVSVELQLQE